MTKSTDMVLAGQTGLLNAQQPVIPVSYTLMRGEKRQIARNAGKMEFAALRHAIQDLLRKEFDARKTYEFLLEKHQIAMSYRTFARYFRLLKMTILPGTPVGSRTQTHLPQAPRLPALQTSERPAPGKRYQYKPPTEEELKALISR